MEQSLGVTGDPITGFVQIPCIERNTMGADYGGSPIPCESLDSSKVAFTSTPASNNRLPGTTEGTPLDRIGSALLPIGDTAMAVQAARLAPKGPRIDRAWLDQIIRTLNLDRRSHAIALKGNQPCSSVESSSSR